MAIFAINFQLSAFSQTADGMAGRWRLQFLDRYLVICIDAHPAGNLHSFFSNLARGELRVVGQCLRGSLGKWASRAYGRNSGVGLDYVTLPAQQEGLFLV